MTSYRAVRRSAFGFKIIRGAATVAACIAALSVGACNILDVSNPNNVPEEDLEGNPAIAGPLVSGLVASTTRAIGAIFTSYSTATDELTFVGSRDAYNQLDRGSVGDPSNEFVDASFFYVAEARFLGNNAIDRLLAFGFDDPLAFDDRKTLLARAYLYSAVIYTTIADQFDDFAFSEKPPGQLTVAGDNIGPANMVQLYDSAIVYLDRALPLAQDVGDSDLEAQILAMRARAKHARAVWQLLNPSGRTPSNPLVNDAGANADASAALAIWTGDENFQLSLAPQLSDGAVSIGFNVNSRLEVRVGDFFIVPSGKRFGSVRLRDPITNTADAVLLKFVPRYSNTGSNRDFPQLIMASAREMYLILAEAALAQDNTGSSAGFRGPINTLRTLDNLPAFTGQVPALQLLTHSRAVNLFLQGRRLSDLYRFGLKSDKWDPAEDAVTCPGTFFPITVTERQSNPLASDSPVGCNI